MHLAPSALVYWPLVSRELRVRRLHAVKSTSKLASDVAAWVSTITSTVFLIFVNKLLKVSSGCGFHYSNSGAILLL